MAQMNPWVSFGIGAGVGLTFGYLFGRPTTPAFIVVHGQLSPGPPGTKGQSMKVIQEARAPTVTEAVKVAHQLTKDVMPTSSEEGLQVVYVAKGGDLMDGWPVGDYEDRWLFKDLSLIGAELSMVGAPLAGLDAPMVYGRAG